jgi:subtilase family serine protease
MRGNGTLITVLLVLCVMPAVEAVALPDAVVVRIAAEATDIEAGQHVPIEVTLANQGTAVLPPVLVVLLIDDRPHAEWKLAEALSPGERAERTLTWTAERGSHIILAQVDPLNDVREADERNNSAFLSLGVAEEPEPSPWPALLVGLASLLLGVLLGLLVRRKHHRGPAPSRFQRPPKTAVK